MNAVREFPPNPHALVIHVDRLLTGQIVETYLSSAGATNPGWPGWVRAVLALPGVRVLSINAYKIRLQKHKDAGWRDVQPAFEAILRERLGVQQVLDLLHRESPRRRFAWHGERLARTVYEGTVQAAADPLASELFRVHGVAEVILDGHQVEVRKCPLCDWSEMDPEIERRLARMPSRAPDEERGGLRPPRR